MKKVRKKLTWKRNYVTHSKIYLSLTAKVSICSISSLEITLMDVSHNATDSSSAQARRRQRQESRISPICRNLNYINFLNINCFRVEALIKKLCSKFPRQ